MSPAPTERTSTTGHLVSNTTLRPPFAMSTPVDEDYLSLAVGLGCALPSRPESPAAASEPHHLEPTADHNHSPDVPEQQLSIPASKSETAEVEPEREVWNRDPLSVTLPDRTSSRRNLPYLPPFAPRTSVGLHTTSILRPQKLPPRPLAHP